MNMKNATTAMRLLLGLMFLVFGLNGFLGFIPQPQPEGIAAQFLGGLASAPYFFPLLKGTEILIGLALLSNRFVPAALTVLAPITINIVAFHLFLDPTGIPMVAFIGALHLFLMFSYRNSYSAVLNAKAEPVTTSLEKVPVHA